MAKIKLVYDNDNVFDGYKQLAELITKTQNLSSVLEMDIEIRGIEDCTFNVRCFDGIALGVNDKMNVILTYPPKNELTHEQLQQCLKYRGLEHNISVFGMLTAVKTTFGDIMMSMGEVVMVHHKKNNHGVYEKY